jgi:translation initiation factor IF-3
MTHQQQNKRNMRRENFGDRFFRTNERIRFSPVILIDKDGNNLGKFHVDKAREFAYRDNLDLVEVSPDSRPPICKIMDYSKYKYEKKIKEKKQKQNKKQSQKEIRLSCNIAENDLKTKANMTINFLKSDYKVQIKLQYKRRQNTHKELGFVVMNNFKKMIEDHGDFVSPPKLDGNILFCCVVPKK